MIIGFNAPDKPNPCEAFSDKTEAPNPRHPPSRHTTSADLRRGAALSRLQTQVYMTGSNGP